MNPQRILANDRNLIRTASLVASSTKPVTNQVLALKNARSGSARATLTGTFTGDEEADYDVQIVDESVETPLISTPTFSGAGSGTLSGISATGTAQVYTVELSVAGIAEAQAAVQLEGVSVEARVAGDAGNDIRITVDQSGMTFADSDYTILQDLSSGDGGIGNPFLGEGFGWASAVLAADGTIPDSAPRVAFGDDESQVHLAYKQFTEGRWEYHVIPALTRDIPKGTIVKFVTGGRTVTVSDGGSNTESTSGIVTAFDFLNWIRTSSTLLVVDGVVPRDRTPTGIAAREFSLRTDAHANASYGEGSAFATGFADVTVEETAGQQLVTATCFAVNQGDHPLARLGSERWQLKSTLLGDLGTIVTGERYSGSQFGLTIPVKLPPGYGAPKGRFGVDSITYASRADTETEPPICPVALTLGPNAVDETITLVYTTRPSGDCDCDDMSVPNLNTACLGNPSGGGGSVTYQTATISRLKEMRAWGAGVFRDFSRIDQAVGSYSSQSFFLVDPIDSDSGVTKGHKSSTNLSLRDLLNEFERTLARIDTEVADFSSGSLGLAGAEVWDTALTDLKNDVASITGSPSHDAQLYNLPTDRYIEKLKQALTYAGLSPLGGDDASIISGDGCWQDYGDAAWWTVTGSVTGSYGPAFTNHPYYSVQDGGHGYFSTHGFAFQVNVKCPDDLRDGDTIVLVISGAGWGASYQQGDVLTLPIVAAAPLYLTGGRDGAPTQTWNVNGSETGPMPAYTFNPDSPVAYEHNETNASLTFLVEPGGIDFAKGDRFRFQVEGGHYRWRKDAGAWQESSPLAAIPASSALIEEGLSIAFSTGAATSFAAGDIFKFRALQPYALSNLQAPSRESWRWDGTSATLDIDFGATESLTMLALIHDIPEGATITLSGAIGSGTDWTETLTWREGCIWASFEHSARYVRLTLTGAGDGGIQWAWLGEALVIQRPAELQISRTYQVNRAQGNLQASRFVAKAISGEMEWSEGAMTDDDVDALAAMLDHIKEHDDEAIIVVPQVTRTADPVIFATISSDDVVFDDMHSYQPNAGLARAFAARLPLDGVLQ